MEPAQLLKATVKNFYPVKLILEQRKINAQYSKEISLLSGKHKSENLHPSILFFTLHKCASVYVKDLLFELAEDVGMTPINFGGYLWKSAKSPKELEEQLKKAFKPVGYFYGPFRETSLLPQMQDLGGYRLINNLDSYKILLMLRDPRDVLTSKYFSMAYSHHIPELQKEKMLAKREDALKTTIDEFVTSRSQMNEFLKKYSEYSKELMDRPNVLFVKYEDMVNDFETWLNSVIKFLELDVSKEKVNKIVSKADFTVDKEDIHSHKRQVTPGDHQRKLKPETIEVLNSEFGEILDKFGYAR